MYNMEWSNTKKEIDPKFVGSIFEELGFDKELCPTCKAHLKDGICLNMCHLSKDTQEKYHNFMQAMNKDKKGN